MRPDERNRHDHRRFRDALSNSSATGAYSALARPTSDDAGFALTEAETNEFAVRLIDARSEAELFDHLLGAILTHAAAHAGSALQPMPHWRPLRISTHHP